MGHKKNLDVPMIDRRTFVLAATAATISGREALAGGAAPPAAAPAPTTFDEAYKRIVGSAKPEDAKITVELPEIAENGNTVPYSVAVESPMTNEDHVKALHVIATANPQPLIATFVMGPVSGKAAVSSRLRLAKTQDVVFLAELSNGKFLTHRRPVKVTIGGCGG